MKPVVGITLGDPAGIGPEVVAKSLAKPSIRRLAHFKVIGDYGIFRSHASRCYRNCDFIDLVSSPSRKIKIGRPNPQAARASLVYLQKAVELLKTGEINALVTAPVSKEAITALGKHFHGHTEFLAQAFHIKNFEMMFVSQSLRTIVVTRHIPLQRVSQTITTAKISNTIQLANKSLKEHFKIKRPRIAVCGLNPHAGEGGSMGREEITKIIPSIHRARKNGIHVEGPFPADTLFSPPICSGYDLIIAMYHDQGLIPVKALYFSKLVNLTIGLPFIRTSPAHGTAFNIAGKNKADPSSMSEAIQLACHLCG